MSKGPFAYRLFGHSVALPFAAAAPLEPGSGVVPDLELCEVEPGDPFEDGPEADWIYTSPLCLADGTPYYRFGRFREEDGPGGILRVGRLLDLGYSWDEYGRPDSIVTVRRLENVGDDAVEAYFLGTALPLWLEMGGWLCLHAAAVELAGSGRRVGFLGASGTGKSTLAAALLARGHALVTGDVLPVRPADETVEHLPGVPELTLADEIAGYFVGEERHELPRETFGGSKRRLAVGDRGRWQRRSLGGLLDALFVLDRVADAAAESEARREWQDDGVAFEPLSRRQGVVELLRFAFHARLVEAVGLAPARLDALAQVVVSLPVERLCYRSGLADLDAVCAAVEARAGS